VEILYERLVLYRPRSFRDCLSFAYHTFHYQYHQYIQELLLQYPEDAITSYMMKFWSEERKLPSVLAYDPTDPNHQQYILLLAQLYSEMYGVEVLAEESVDVWDMLAAITQEAPVARYSLDPSFIL
jgi:ubiquitin-activating enzyme E1